MTPEQNRAMDAFHQELVKMDAMAYMLNEIYAADPRSRAIHEGVAACWFSVRDQLNAVLSSQSLERLSA